jgi:hypothetical protein
MKIIRPTPVTDATLISSTIAEDDFPEWSAATNYAVGAFVISIATHTVYRSLTADNLNNNPDLEQAALADPLIADPDPINWQVIGATDRFKLFDSKPSQQATRAENITIVNAPGVFIGGVAGFNISANSVSITMNEPSIARRNLLTWTDQFENAVWSKVNLTISPNAAVAPDGTLTADKLVENTATGNHNIARTVSVEAGIKYTLSNHFKASERNRVNMLVPSFGFGAATNITFDLLSGTIISSLPQSVQAFILPLPDGWFRCGWTATATATASGGIQAGRLVQNPDERSYTGDGSSGLFVWGAQFETGPLSDYQFVEDALTFDQRVYSHTVMMQDESGVIDALTYFFSEIVELSEFVLTDLPPYSSALVTVSLDRDAGNVSVGQIVMGPVWETGLTFADGSGFSGLDFSFVQADDFGNLTRVVREATTIHNFEVFLDATQLLAFKTRMRSLRGGVPAVFIGAPERAKSAINYGILRDYRVAYRTPLYSIINLETQGLV